MFSILDLFKNNNKKIQRISKIFYKVRKKWMNLQVTMFNLDNLFIQQPASDDFRMNGFHSNILSHFLFDLGKFHSIPFHFNSFKIPFPIKS